MCWIVPFLSNIPFQSKTSRPAPCEAQTHDLQIMRLTRCLLIFSLLLVGEPTGSPIHKNIYTINYHIIVRNEVQYMYNKILLKIDVLFKQIRNCLNWMIITFYVVIIVPSVLTLIRKFIYLHIYTHAHSYIYIHIHTHTPIHTYIHTYTHTRIHIYTHTHIHHNKILSCVQMIVITVILVSRE